MYWGETSWTKTDVAVQIKIIKYDGAVAKTSIWSKQRYMLAENTLKQVNNDTFKWANEDTF